VPVMWDRPLCRVIASAAWQSSPQDVCREAIIFLECSARCRKNFSNFFAKMSADNVVAAVSGGIATSYQGRGKSKKI